MNSPMDEPTDGPPDPIIFQTHETSGGHFRSKWNHICSLNTLNYFWSFSINIFRLQFTMGNGNCRKWSQGCWSWGVGYCLRWWKPLSMMTLTKGGFRKGQASEKKNRHLWRLLIRLWCIEHVQNAKLLWLQSNLYKCSDGTQALSELEVQNIKR